MVLRDVLVSASTNRPLTKTLQQIKHSKTGWGVENMGNQRLRTTNKKHITTCKGLSGGPLVT